MSAIWASQLVRSVVRLITCFNERTSTAPDHMRLSTRQFGTEMTLTRQAAPGAPREVVARIPLSKWPTPSWIHDFPVTCVAACFMQPCLCHTTTLTINKLAVIVFCKVCVMRIRRPNYAIVPEQPCCFNLQVRAARSAARNVDQPCLTVGMHHGHQPHGALSELNVTHVCMHAGCRGWRRGVHHVRLVP